MTFRVNIRAYGIEVGSLVLVRCDCSARCSWSGGVPAVVCAIDEDVHDLYGRRIKVRSTIDQNVDTFYENMISVS